MRRNESSTTRAGGVGIGGVVQVVFIVLKLCKLINWSWWLVFLPTFISLGLFVFFFVLGMLIAVIDALIHK